MNKTGTNINYAAQCLREGKLVAFPTETVYGLGANALDPIAVAKIFAAKKRPSFDPLIVHIAHLDEIERLLTNPIDERVFQLVKAFWPGPLTIVHKKSDLIPDIVTSGGLTVGIRMPSHPLALELIEATGLPLAAPSANSFGQLSPTTAAHVAKQLKDVDFILDGGATQIGIESTVISLQDGYVEILRPGAITLQQISKIIPDVQMSSEYSNENDLKSPGLLKSHYSPRKPVYLHAVFPESVDDRTAVIASSPFSKIPSCKHIHYLSKDGNLIEVAANLFSAMHQMEENDAVDIMLIESVPEISIGIAIMDRLRKAAFQYLPD